MHFGERCHPIVIINMLLKINVKTLFQLGIYPFNEIVKILEDEQFDDIMDPKLLLYNNNNVKYSEVDKYNGYSHNNGIVNHKKYNIMLVHDYGIDQETNTILNYNFIQKSHKLKQHNFYEYINSGDFLCFITILFDSNMQSLEYERMSNVLLNKYGLKNFVIVIFTNDKTNIPSNLPKCFEFVIVENEYRDDIHRTTEYRIDLYKDMWTKFTYIMGKYGFKYSNFDDQFDINLMPKLNIGDLHEASIKEQKI